MSYIEIEIGGKKRGLKFSQGTLMLFKDSIKDYTDEDVLIFSPFRIVWAALKANCIVKGELVDFTFENVYDWVEKLSEEDLQIILSAFNESVGFNKNDNVEDEKKKKEKVKKKEEKIIKPIVTN